MTKRFLQLALQLPLKFTAALLLVVATAGCGESSKVGVMQRAVAIESADECHLCGMIISSFPGPKGELYTRGQEQVQKFCSTRDLLAFLLQPENTHRASQVFVHDMAVAPWESPDDNAFIDAKSAFYVVDHSQQGAMGPTLASFKTRANAEKFSHQFGGRVIGFGEINLELLAGLSGGAVQMDHGAMDHGAMDHSTMGYESMNHESMDHSAMNHGAMAEEAMEHQGH